MFMGDVGNLPPVLLLPPRSEDIKGIDGAEVPWSGERQSLFTVIWDEDKTESFSFSAIPEYT